MKSILNLLAAGSAIILFSMPAMAGSLMFPRDAPKTRKSNKLPRKKQPINRRMDPLGLALYHANIALKDLPHQAPEDGEETSLEERKKQVKLLMKLEKNETLRKLSEQLDKRELKILNYYMARKLRYKKFDLSEESDKSAETANSSNPVNLKRTGFGNPASQ